MVGILKRSPYSIHCRYDDWGVSISRFNRVFPYGFNAEALVEENPEQERSLNGLVGRLENPTERRGMEKILSSYNFKLFFWLVVIAIVCGVPFWLSAVHIVHK